MSPPGTEPGHRLLAFVLLAAVLALLVLPRVLVPAAEGLGTHRQLGLPPCGLQQHLGIPCPGCGGTTAFALMARGMVLPALRANLAAAALYPLLVLALVPLALEAAGRPSPLLRALVRRPSRALRPLLGLALLSWVAALVRAAGGPSW